LPHRAAAAASSQASVAASCGGHRPRCPTSPSSPCPTTAPPLPYCWPSPPAGQAHGTKIQPAELILHTCQPSSSFLSRRPSSWRRRGPQWLLADELMAAELLATSGETRGELRAAELQQSVFLVIFFGRDTVGYTPQCKRMSAIYVSTGRPKRIESDWFRHQNGSARWRCPNRTVQFSLVLLIRYLRVLVTAICDSYFIRLK
jgi:hypothetical protein